MASLPKHLQEDAERRLQSLAASLRSGGIRTPLSDDQMRTALVFSEYVFRQIRMRPSLLQDFSISQDLLRTYAEGDCSTRLAAAAERELGQSLWQWQVDEAADDSRSAVMILLRHFRHREMIRIAIRDICGLAGLEETMADLTSLADTCLDGALYYLNAVAGAQWGFPLNGDGHPQQMTVLGLGKLGAQELNFSSDVDLMFAFAGKGDTGGGPKGHITNEEFFLRLARALIHLIGHATAEGIVFRVDARLRPFGGSGPLVMNFDQLEDYYQAQGREWERYALIKARPVAGDRQGGRQLLDRLTPFIYRRYLDYGAFDNLREMKGRIDLEVKVKGLQDNIKLGPGGIREIEFFGQMFQLLRGGVDPSLQLRPIRHVLQTLAHRGYIESGLQEFLDGAYLLLRRVENRIQQWADQQDHRLPSDPMQQLRLAASLGYENWQLFSQDLEQIRSQVHDHFNQLLTPDKGTAHTNAETQMSKMLEGVWQGVVDQDQAQSLLQELGYQYPAKVLTQISDLHQDRGMQSMSQVGQARLNRLIPLVLQAVAKAPQADLVLERIFELIRSIHKRTAYLALLLENSSILNHLVMLSGASPWIAGLLCRHPVLLDELLDPRTLYRPPKRTELDAELQKRIAAVDPEDLEYQMEVLRVFKQINLLRVAASDITDVLPLMKVSDHLSDIAETIIHAAATLCWQQLKNRFGTPTCSLADHPCDPGFAVIAYGKLGGLELGYGSDLDLVFIHAAGIGQSLGGPRSIDNTTFFARLGQRVLHLLTTYTSAGVLYEVDMRLRPSGDSGMLVTHIDGFAAYQRDKAWTWEHQALLRARAIFGDARLQQRFASIRREILILPRDPVQLRSQVADMRSRLRKQYLKVDPNRFDIKHGYGGILDIEFIVQYLALHHAHRHPRIIAWTDNVRQIQALNEAGILDHKTAFGLRRAYLIYRAVTHRLSLSQQPALVGDSQFQSSRNFVVRIWQQLFR